MCDMIRQRIIRSVFMNVKAGMCRAYGEKHPHRVSPDTFRELHSAMKARLMAVVDRGRSASVSRQRRINSMFIDRYW